MSIVWIAGAGTDIGKTYVSVALITVLRRRGVEVDALKPVVSGIDDAPLAESDPGRLLAALGRPLDPTHLDQLSPLRFRAPLSPPMAAKLEGRELHLADIVAMCAAKAHLKPATPLLIETAGGVMSPLDDDHTMIDLMAAVPAPVVLVGSSYLGGISHTLTALKCLQQANLPVAAIVMSEAAGDAPDFGETCASVTRLAAGVPVLPAPRGPQWDADELSRLIYK